MESVQIKKEKVGFLEAASKNTYLYTTAYQVHNMYVYNTYEVTTNNNKKMQPNNSSHPKILN